MVMTCHLILSCDRLGRRRIPRGLEGRGPKKAVAASLLTAIARTLFQPQYLIWPVAFTALLPLTGCKGAGSA
jgi:hypothetical protein